MAQELNYYGKIAETGLTVIAKIYNSQGVQVGGDIPCTEAGTLSIYIGSMPTAPIGEYGVRFFNGLILLGQGPIYWSGTAELNFDAYNKVSDTHKIQGLDRDHPLTATRDSMKAGDVDIDIAGNGETLSIFTRKE